MNTDSVTGEQVTDKAYSFFCSLEYSCFRTGSRSFKLRNDNLTAAIGIQQCKCLFKQPMGVAGHIKKCPVEAGRTIADDDDIRRCFYMFEDVFNALLHDFSPLLREHRLFHRFDRDTACRHGSRHRG